MTSDVEAGSSTSFDALSGEDPEPIDNGSIALGRVTYELLAAALEPYPRKPGAQLSAETPVPERSEPDGSGPFAELARLKPTGQPKP